MNKKIKKSLFYIGIIIGIFFFLKTLVFFENQSSESNIKNIYDALWYTFITLSTVGYGDYYPVTLYGKLLGLVVVLGSLGVLSFLVSRISIKISAYMERKKTGQFGTKLKNHFIVIGWDGFSKQVITEIVKSGHKIAIVTDNKNDVDLIYESFPQDLVFVLFADYNHYEALKKVNIKESTKVFVNFDEDSKSLIHIINIQKMYKKLDFVVILDSQDLKETFKSIGITYLVSKNEIASKLVASYIYEPDAAILTEDLMESSNHDEDYDILQYKVLAQNPYLNKDYTDTFFDIKTKYNGILMGISKVNQNYKLLKNPKEKTIIEQNDYMIMMLDAPTKATLSKVFNVVDGKID